ncbi:MAG: carboxypeptidase M32 [Rhodospirillales bacterium]|nr:carboxypeptidase M32 [Rhodospirillales bacterium]
MQFFQKIWQSVKSWVSLPGRTWTRWRESWPSLPFLKPKEIVAPEPAPEPEGPAAPLVVRQDQEHPSTAYTELKCRFRDIGKLSAVEETMGRDSLTAMPEGAWKSRLGQISYLQRHLHEILVDPDVARLIDRAKDHKANNPDDWDNWDSANLHEMEARYDDAHHVGADLIEKKASLSYEGRKVHRDAFSEGDWPTAREFLSKTIDLNKQIAEAKCRASGKNSYYEALTGQYAPGTPLSDIEDWFGTLEKKLKKLLPSIMEKQAKEPDVLPVQDFYPAKAQMWLNHALLETVGFDFYRGGLYETGHNPVEGGTPDDTRLVIKNVDTTNFMLSMRSTLHEGGHGLYTQGLPRKTWRYQPVAQDLGTAVHESQALLVEMLIGRMPEFYEFLSPRLEGLFHGMKNPALSAENLYRTRTRVKPSFNRRNADEVTYFFHVLLRFRLEKQLIEGTLKLADLPEAWNAGMEELLGIRPESDKQGCLQDVHWFVGKFGYFPSYSIGHMIAAQLYASITKAVPGAGAQVRSGDFSHIVGWLRANVHSKGSLLSWDQMLKQATGKTLDPAFLIAHFEKRYAGT